MTPLQRRVAECEPLMDFGLDAILRLLDIEETVAIPTAAIPVGGTPRLLLNPRFIDQNCVTEEDLAVLVLHELHHLLLGHTRLYPRVTPLHNLAFDAVINAMIARARPHARWLALFQRLYRPDVFPELLLRPPDGFPGPLSFPPATPRAVQRVLTDLYASGAGTFRDSFELLLLELSGIAGGLPVLLGSHGDEGAEQARDAALRDAVTEIVSRWPPTDPRVGRSVAGALAESVRPLAAPRAEPPLVRALLAAAGRGDRRFGPPEPMVEPATLAWPTRDRRAFVQAAAGAPPLLYSGSLIGRPRRSPRAPVAVYLDVSGSVSAEIPRLLAAIDGCRRQIAPTVFQFSCGVQAVSLADVRRGLVRSAGGTCGEDFAAHIAATRPAGAVVLTDGVVGPITPAHAAACRAARLQVVLTPDGERGDLAAAAAAFHQLEPA